MTELNSVAAGVRTEGPPSPVETLLVKIPKFDYIHHPSFDAITEEGERAILAAMPETEDYHARWAISRTFGGDDPSYVTTMCEAPVLTKAQERHLFRQFNYLKLKANALRAQIETGDWHPRLLAAYESLGARVCEVRNQLVESNLRLVVSLVKKRNCPTPEEFSERLSDGTWSLIRAIENFDYGLNNKFATYATWSITRNWYHQVPKGAPTALGGLDTHDDNVLQAIPDHRATGSEEETNEDASLIVEQLLRNLDKRWQRVVRMHSGLGQEKKTLNEIGEHLNISRERARQIRSKSIARMREVALTYYPNLVEAYETAVR